MGATLTVKYNSDNASTNEDPSGEAVQILDRIKKDIYNSYGQECDGYIRDLNGNRIGEWSFDIDEDEDEDEEF